MKRNVIVAGALAIVGMLGVLSGPVSAAVCPPDSLNPAGNSLAECNIEPGNSPDDAKPVIQSVLEVIFALMGVVAVFVMILGGFYLMTSQGDSAKVTRGKNTILYGVVGLVVAMLAFAIVNFVLGKIA